MAEIVHTLNRGVDKRKIFLNDQDRLRFIHDLFEFNDKEWVESTSYAFRTSRAFTDIAKRKRRKRKLLVEVLAFCLMPNHYHLLLQPKSEGSIPAFMKKLNMGYAKYFNEKYERNGTLFEGRYKSVRVSNDTHFIHLLYYIHCNPLDLIVPEWRRREMSDDQKAIEFLASYRWSSHLDYMGKKNFPSVTNREFLLEYFGGEEGYAASFRDWLRDFDAARIADVTLGTD